MPADAETMGHLWREIISVAAQIGADPNNNFPAINPSDRAFLSLGTLEIFGESDLRLTCATDAVYGLLSTNYLELLATASAAFFGPGVTLYIISPDGSHSVHASANTQKPEPQHPAVPDPQPQPQPEQNYSPAPYEQPAHYSEDPKIRSGQELKERILREQIRREQQLDPNQPAPEVMPPEKFASELSQATTPNPQAAFTPEANPSSPNYPAPTQENSAELPTGQPTSEPEAPQQMDYNSPVPMPQDGDDTFILPGRTPKTNPAPQKVSRDGNGSVLVNSGPASTNREPEVDPKSRLNSRYTFNNFIHGRDNKLVWASCIQVVDHPGEYQPVFIWGNSGLGKTHLLHAIGNYYRFLRPSANILYITMEEFTNDFINAIGDPRFKNRYRNLDLLLIDDVQFLENKISTQEEFFHTINSLIIAGKQIVMTSDRHPDRLATLNNRLITRFKAGLTLDVAVPDLETRIAVLRAEFQQIDGMDVDSAALELIAQHYSSSVRELLGGAKSIVMTASIENIPRLEVDFVQKALARIIPESGEKPVTLEMIVNLTARYFGIETASLLSKDKTRKVTHARQIAMHLARELTDLSLPHIGDSFGGKDHSTVLYADRKIRTAIKNDPLLKSEVDAITDLIRSDKMPPPDADALPIKRKNRPSSPAPAEFYREQYTPDPYLEDTEEPSPPPPSEVVNPAPQKPPQIDEDPSSEPRF
ncbi:MAG: chromosomal replication initiator protein DnaA [Corynebacterium sp.]|nr:chromosomal replication initiator protein DnaA [Corynebacterium sp.]